MTSFAGELQAVIQALAQTTSPTIISKYQETISKSSDTLDEGAKGANTTLTDRVTVSCTISRIVFGDNAIFPEESSYIEEQQENWSTTCWLPAACFVKIQNTVELALALKIVTRMQSKFVVRSVGHMANPGFSSVDGSGIVLDLNALDEITLSPKTDTVSVGPGATWGKVYEELEKHELKVVGGRANDVGVGGLIIGGGMSHFSNQWGMVCDNVKNFEVVLADSTIVQANAEENSDLFRALKGGGPNFGIVTRFDLYTRPDYRVWYTVQVYNASDSEGVMKASMKVQEAMEEDDRIGFFLSINTSFFVAGLLYMGGCTTSPSVFSIFNDIVPMATAVPETNGTQLSAAKALNIEGKMKREVGAITVRPNVELYVELHKILSKITTSTAFTLAFTVQPIGASAIKKGQKYGGNSMNILPENQSWLGVLVQWSEDANDDLARSQIRQLISSIESTAKARELLMDFQFMNDASYIQSPLKGYGKEGLATLDAVSGRRDPEGVFQQLQNSGFLLSKIGT